ncbi:bifunctional 4-hydroxy-2-oxoglutarate aldolase/2-dehydro-3-deoxy-phosphogluconate aldolase [Neolewinella sp.]|uniref:bifunctional 4-hydroxy-2-oxoglutarate aldolase/2-dehydro-3-deoxy-phosphogluconate aldolase n=1 Tax=Neolewinella sp. TaxID=2993543 RepID=UPI003B515D8B
MNDQRSELDSLRELPVIAILRGWPTETVLRIAGTCVATGFTTVEVTMNSPEAETCIRRLTEQFSELTVGAGTVRTRQEMNRALGAGAQFIVTPVLDQSLIRHCVREGIPVFPGAFSPTEIHQAWSWGATAVKVFPADMLGADYLRAVLAPLDDVKLLPTGGVNHANVGTFFAAGATAVGMGGGLLDKRMINSDDFSALSSHMLRIRASLPTLR